MRKHYPVKISDENGIVYYPFSYKSTGVFEKIAFGNQTIAAACLPHPGKENEIVLSKDVAEKLRFPNMKASLHLFADEQTLYLGPLIGIFTSGFIPFQMKPIGERSSFFAKILAVNKSVGAIAYIFGMQHIDWESGVIKGYFYEKSQWKTFEVPFPNVIYDRLPNRQSEKLIQLKKIKERLEKDYLIPWFNPGFFNKLDIFEKLQQDDIVSSYLPETHPFTSFSIMERMLADYGHVYVKPKNGSLGFAVHQIIYDRKKSIYYCRFRDLSGKNKLRKFFSLEALMTHVFANRKLSSMIVQQGIHLIRENNRPLDFRVHTNKDDNGEWKVTAIAAKIAGEGSVTTHLNNGGTIKTLAEICTTAEQEQGYKQQLIDAALTISKALDQQIPGIIAEIGFDFGIDRNGKLWLFEANSKPGRAIFKHPHLKQFDLLSWRLSLSFAVFLTEKAIMKPGEIFK
ncbi:YheC/YheD family protein [Bacillaceae bacterium Marseille-Q3522]|nr:YheC/YheD family protein [Bacillaceae bacterium Marseille-Q3522]